MHCPSLKLNSKVFLYCISVRFHGLMQAHKPEVQDLLQKLCTDLFSERPEKPLDYMIRWLGE